MNAEAHFPSEPASVAAARRFVDDALAAADRATQDVVKLLVSELATNAVEHGSTDFRLLLVHRDAVVRVDVTDEGGGHPVLRSPSDREPRGRGLRIVAALSKAWGITRSGPSTTVWFEVPSATGGAGSDGDGSTGAAHAARPVPPEPAGVASEDPASGEVGRACALAA